MISEKLLEFLKDKQNGVYYLNALLLNKNFNFGYHNTTHCLMVASKVLEYATKEYGVHEVETKELVLAAMFHDWGHSNNKKLPDSYNVDKAKNYFKAISLESEDDTQIILDLIQTTEYPHSYPKLLPMTHGILRDADLFYFYQGNGIDWNQQYIKGNVVGLHEEWNRIEPMTKEQHAEASYKFWESVKPFTEYGKADLEKVIREILDINSTAASFEQQYTQH